MEVIHNPPAERGLPGPEEARAEGHQRQRQVRVPQKEEEEKEKALDSILW